MVENDGKAMWSKYDSDCDGICDLEWAFCIERNNPCDFFPLDHYWPNVPDETLCHCFAVVPNPCQASLSVYQKLILNLWYGQGERFLVAVLDAMDCPTGTYR